VFDRYASLAINEGSVKTIEIQENQENAHA